MYQTSYLEDYVEKLYRHLKINRPEELNKYVIGDSLNIGVYPADAESEAFYFDNRYYIFINRSLNQRLRWQEFGHELCHVLRHSGHQNKMQPMFRDLQEWQADNFMYHFCIPTFMLHHIWLPPDQSDAVRLIAETFCTELSFAEKRLAGYYAKRKDVWQRSEDYALYGSWERQMGVCR